MHLHLHLPKAEPSDEQSMMTTWFATINEAKAVRWLSFIIVITCRC